MRLTNICLREVVYTQKHPHKPRSFIKVKWLIAPGITSAAAWFYWEFANRRPILKRLSQKESKFRGDTPFYGKLWGYSTDYLIEQSLQEGDLLYISYDPKSLHLQNAISKYISNYFSDTSFDEIAMVYHISGMCYLVSLHPFRGFLIEKFSDKLAYSHATLISLRRIQYPSTDLRQKIHKSIQTHIEKYSGIQPSILPDFWWNFLRTRFHKKYFSILKRFLASELEIRSHQTIIARLQELLQDTIQAPSKPHLDTNSHFTNNEKQNYPKNISSKDIDKFYPELKPYTKIIRELIQQHEKKIEDITQEDKNIHSSYSFPGKLTQCHTHIQERENISLIQKLIASINRFILRNSNPCDSPSSFVSSVYQMSGLLPDFIPPQAWTFRDLSTIDTLSLSDTPINIDSKSYSILPFLSNHFYIRQKDSEKRQM